MKFKTKYDERLELDDFGNLRQEFFYEYIREFRDLFYANIEFSNLPTNVPKEFLLTGLYEHGRIGYDKTSSDFYYISSSGAVTPYNLSENYTLVTANGYTISRPLDKVAILKASPTARPWFTFSRVKASQLAIMEMAILQNTLITMNTLYANEDEFSNKTLKDMFQQRAMGVPCIIMNKGKKNTDGISKEPFIVGNTGAEFFGDKYMAIKKTIHGEALTRLGVPTQGSKKEREITDEVDANLAEAFDAISVLIKTFNEDAEFFNVPVRCKFTGQLEKIEDRLDEQEDDNGRQNTD